MDANRLRELIDAENVGKFQGGLLHPYLYENRHEIVRALEDAERYRTIRNKDFMVHRLFSRHSKDEAIGYLESFLHTDDLDAAIDAARGEA